MRLNNCYCYALNKPSDNWCDPGKANGAGIGSESQLNCASLTAAVVADGGKTVSREEVRHYVNARGAAPGTVLGTVPVEGA